MEAIYIISIIIYLVITILVIVKICQIANNTKETNDLLRKMVNQDMPDQETPQVSTTNKNEDDNSVFPMVVHY
jgi:hypothetical protein